MAYTVYTKTGTDGAIAAQAASDSATYQAKLNAAKSMLGWYVPTDPTFGIDNTGATDVTTALNTFLAAAAATSVSSVKSLVNGTSSFPLYPTVFIPDGVYSITGSLIKPVGLNLVLAMSAVIRATSAFSAAMLTMSNSTGTIDQHVRIEGGIWDANLNAQDGIYLPYFANIRIADVQIHNPTRHFLILGDPAATSSSYEAVITNLDTRRNRGATIPAGSYGIWFQNASDCEVWQAVLNGTDTGVRSELGNHNFYGVHVWNFGGSTGPTCGFDDNTSTDNIYSGCYVDGATGQGFRLRKGYGMIVGSRVFVGSVTDNVLTAVQNDGATGLFTVIGLRVTGGSRTFSDAVLNSTTTLTSATGSFTSSDVGRNISGTGIPANTSVSSVTNSTTVIISAAATATATGVTVTVANRILNDITGDISQAEILSLYPKNVTNLINGNRSRLRGLLIQNPTSSSSPLIVRRTASNATQSLIQYQDETTAALARMSATAEEFTNGIGSAVNTKTSGSYTMTASDSVIFSNGATGITLPSATTAASANIGGGYQARRYTIRNIHASSAVTIGASAGTVDGGATLSLAAGASKTFTSDGTNWWSI